MWPAALSVLVLAVGGVAGLGLVATGIVERRTEVAHARADLVRVVLEERALVEQVPYAGTARKALERIERDPDSSLRPAREVARRVVRGRDALTRARPDQTARILRVEAALRAWEAAEEACRWTCR
jgi:hypothetical protein